MNDSRGTMKRRFQVVFTYLILAFLLSNNYALAQSATKSAEKTAPLQQKLQQQLDAWHAAGKFPGATLGVALADGTSFGLAVGVSDRERKTPMKPSDLMLQGSVGKTYVTAVALQLVHEGKLDLDSKIEKYLGK